MKTIKYFALLVALFIAIPTIAQEDIKASTTKKASVEEKSSSLDKLLSDAGAFTKGGDKVSTETGVLNNYVYTINESQQGKRVDALVNSKHGYSLVLVMSDTGDHRKYCTGNDFYCQAISGGVKCGTEWKPWCYLPEDEYDSKEAPQIDKTEDAWWKDFDMEMEAKDVWEKDMFVSEEEVDEKAAVEEVYYKY